MATLELSQFKKVYMKSDYLLLTDNAAWPSECPMWTRKAASPKVGEDSLSTPAFAH